MARNEAVAKAQREKFVEAARRAEVASDLLKSAPTETASMNSEDEHQPRE